jgi:hypothetical protein
MLCILVGTPQASVFKMVRSFVPVGLAGAVPGSLALDELPSMPKTTQVPMRKWQHYDEDFQGDNNIVEVRNLLSLYPMCHKGRTN